MSKQLKHSNSYKIHYTSGPGKSYVIEPKGGELNYDLAHKNPQKFYESVIRQDVIEHKVSRQKDEDGHYVKGNHVSYSAKLNIVPTYVLDVS